MGKYDTCVIKAFRDAQHIVLMEVVFEPAMFQELVFFCSPPLLQIVGYSLLKKKRKEKRQHSCVKGQKENSVVSRENKNKQQISKC